MAFLVEVFVVNKVIAEISDLEVRVAMLAQSGIFGNEYKQLALDGMWRAIATRLDILLGCLKLCEIQTQEAIASVSDVIYSGEVGSYETANSECVGNDSARLS